MYVIWEIRYFICALFKHTCNDRLQASILTLCIWDIYVIHPPDMQQYFKAHFTNVSCYQIGVAALGVHVHFSSRASK